MVRAVCCEEHLQSKQRSFPLFFQAGFYQPAYQAVSLLLCQNNIITLRNRKVSQLKCLRAQSCPVQSFKDNKLPRHSYNKPSKLKFFFMKTVSHGFRSVSQVPLYPSLQKLKQKV